MKNQKKSQKIEGNSLKQKLTIEDKEKNKLRAILNTNASMKSQISSIYQDQKEEENSKENEEEKKRDICPYFDNFNLRINKKKHKNESISLIERKLSSFNDKNRRNLLRMNYNNKSNNSKNSKNNSKRIHSCKKNKNINTNKSNNKNNQNYSNNNINSEYKYKTIANIYNSGNITKRIRKDNSIKIKHKIKKSSYYNYNSINSLRLKRLDKSISRSMPSKRGAEESFNKNYFYNINRSDISTNKNKKILKNNHVIKNKILINYNTNIINTNIDLDKSSINKKMKEIKKGLEEKVRDITRNKNKKNTIKRTISAYYDTKDYKSSIFLEKTKTGRESSFRHKNFYNIDKNNSIKIRKNKNIYGIGLYNINNEYNSNFFRKNFPQLALQQKNKEGKKEKKMKIKLKDNSMFNIKIDNSKDYSKNNIFMVQPYTGKNPNEEKKIKRIIKNSSTININKNIITIKKNPIYDTNINKILKSNLYNSGLAYKNYNNFDKISILFDKNLSKNAYKTIMNKLNINSSTNRINTSLRNFIFSNCISNSNIS